MVSVKEESEHLTPKNPPNFRSSLRVEAGYHNLGDA